MSQATLDELLVSAIESGAAPGVAAIAVNRDGIVYEGAAGQARVAENVPLGLDAVFRIASMTKIITSVAALQLVDRGLLALDAPASNVLPALAKLDLLLPSGEVRPAERPVTLRHLLTHTAGLSYPFTHPGLAAHVEKRGSDGALPTPLVFEPGDGWQYGTNTDWAGRMVEAASGQNLDAYMRAHIFAPLGMPDSGFLLSEGQVERLSSAHAKASDGTFDKQPFRPPKPPPSYSGGGGLYSTARDYARFLQAILNAGELDGVRLLSPESMAGLRTNHSGEHVAGRWRTASPAFSNDTDFSMGGTARHSLGAILSTQDSPNGRAAGSLNWGGIYNTYYWIDPARGIAGATFMQFLPFADPGSLAVMDAFEREVYAAFA